MFKARWLQNLHQLTLCALAFSIPYPYLFGSVCIIAVAFFWLLTNDLRQTWHNLKGRKAFWLWFGYYILLAISSIYSENKANSYFDLQAKMSMVILPLVIGCGKDISRRHLQQVFISFVSGISVVALFCIGRAYYLWQHTHDTGVFFYHTLVEGFNANAVYMAWYAIFGISILLFTNWEGIFQSRTGKTVKILLALLLTGFMILLSARTLLALFIIFLIPFYLSKAFKNQRISKLQSRLIAGALVLLVGFIVFTKNPIRDRYENILENDVQKAWLNDYSHVSESDFSNLTLRLLIWRIGIDNVVEKNLWITGCGNGDTKDLMNDKLIELKFRNIHPELALRSPFYGMNFHNMYLQSLVMIGLPGLVLFVVMVFMPLIKINKIKIHKSLFYIYFLISAVFLFQEAGMQTQAGIIYYSFVSAIFWNLYYTYDKNKMLSNH